MKDFLDNEISEGDIVVYPAGSGRSITMIKAEVKSIKDNGVVVQPLHSSRWSHHSNKTIYRDSRTGRSFQPYSEGARQHMQRPYGYINNDTGEWVEYDLHHLPRQERVGQYSWAPVIWRDYVEKVVEAPKPVHLKITENIVLIEKAATS